MTWRFQTMLLCPAALLLASAAPSAPADDLAANFALPIASGLAGARDVPRFAWIENAAGVRDVWIGGPDLVAHPLTGEIWLWERGSGARRLAAVTGEVQRLTWSPDGTRLLFADDRGDHGLIGLLDIATGKPAWLPPGLGYAVEPVFSPDGRQVSFISFVDPPADAPRDGGSYWCLRVADVASGVTRTVWTVPEGIGGRWYGTRSRNLFWSADGKLVFPLARSGWVLARAVDARGGDAHDLTPGDFGVEGFVPGTDGRSIVYAANAGNLDSRHLWRHAPGGDTAVRLTGGAGFEAMPTLAGTALAALAPARTSDIFAGGVDLHGVHTLVRPPDKALPPDAAARAQQVQWQSSPMGAIAGWRSPVLLIHGDDDRNVDFGQSLLLARALTARHVSFRELVFPASATISSSMPTGWPATVPPTLFSTAP